MQNKLNKEGSVEKLTKPISKDTIKAKPTWQTDTQFWKDIDTKTIKSETPSWDPTNTGF